MECDHKHDQVVWIGNDKKVYMQCGNCQVVISPTVNFELVKKFPPDYRPTLTPIMATIRK